MERPCRSSLECPNCPSMKGTTIQIIRPLSPLPVPMRLPCYAPIPVRGSSKTSSQELHHPSSRLQLSLVKFLNTNSSHPHLYPCLNNFIQFLAHPLLFPQEN